MPRRALPLLLALMVMLLPLPAAPVGAAESESGATMAAPVVFLLEQPSRQLLAPVNSRKAVALVALALALLYVAAPRFSSVAFGSPLIRRVKPRLHALCKLQLEGG